MGPHRTPIELVSRWLGLCLYVLMQLSPLFSPSLFISFLHVCPLVHRAMLFPYTKVFIRPSQPFPIGGLRAEESPSEWAFIWSCASRRRGLILKGPSVDPLSSTERGRPDGYLSFSERLAQGGPGRPTKTPGLYRILPLLFIHFRSQSA